MCVKVEEWIAKVEAVLAASTVKLVGVDLEYTTKLRYSPQKVAVLQLCVGTDVLVYHLCHADKKCEKVGEFLWGYRYVFAGFAIVQDKKVLANSDLYIHNFKDIQSVWRDPDNTRKRTQGLKDVAGAIIDPYYLNMKDGFGDAEHRMWSDRPPLPDKHLEYAARDAYATYEVYRKLDVYERGFFSLFKNAEKKRARYW